MPFSRSFRLAATSAASLLLATTALFTVPAPVAAAGGSALVDVANGYRVGQGLGPVTVHAKIDAIATERGRQLESVGFTHDFDYLRQRFAEEGICWSAFGEIIAYNSTGTAASFGQQWWNSAPHKSIMLGGYSHAGGAIEAASGGRYYGVMVFVKLCGASLAPPPEPIAGFTDIGSSPFVDDIVWLVDKGITKGCSDTRFCPRAAVLRDQMASFLARAQQLPATSTDYFADDWFTSHEPDINRIAAAGVTEGCGSARYCPRDMISRAEMASFLVRALGLPATGRDYFTDDAGSLHEDAINRLAAAGITTGCTATTFCPTKVVTREQMAAFLHRSLD